jgi:hypothetical protein
LLAVAAAACDETTGPDGTAEVRIQLTDAPSDMIATADVWISRVYLMPADSGGEAVELMEAGAPAKKYDLLLLRDGVTAELTGAAAIEPGMYRQLRLVVDSAVVTLVDGFTFSDGSTSRNLKVPSGSTSGIKVQLEEPIDAAEGESTTLVVDFDVDQNFKLQGNPNTPAGIHGILFTPVLHEKSRITSN